MLSNDRFFHRPFQIADKNGLVLRHCIGVDIGRSRRACHFGDRLLFFLGRRLFFLFGGLFLLRFGVLRIKLFSPLHDAALGRLGVSQIAVQLLMEEPRAPNRLGMIRHGMTRLAVQGGDVLQVAILPMERIN